MQPVCVKCKYFYPIGDVGQCRRFPPNQDGKGNSTIDEFSMVRKNYWCGEYKKGAKK